MPFENLAMAARPVATRQDVTPRRRVVVSRKLPAPVEARLRQDYDATLNEADKPLGRECLARSCTDADALVCTVGDMVDAALIAALPPRLCAIARRTLRPGVGSAPRPCRPEDQVNIYAPARSKLNC
jgi:uncharacterized protein (UPF0218 family)